MNRMNLVAKLGGVELCCGTEWVGGGVMDTNDWVTAVINRFAQTVGIKWASDPAEGQSFMQDVVLFSWLRFAVYPLHIDNELFQEESNEAPRVPSNCPHRRLLGRPTTCRLRFAFACEYVNYEAETFDLSEIQHSTAMCNVQSRPQIRKAFNWSMSVVKHK